jgi:hypothetical protein
MEYREDADEACIYTHLCLGDMLICNGIIRTLAKRHNILRVACKENNKDSVSFMLRDVDNIIMCLGNGSSPWEDTDVLKEFSNWPTLIVGHQHLDRKFSSFDAAFYNQTGISFDVRWSSYNEVQRDVQREQDLFHRLGVTDGGYILLHEDKARGYVIDRSRLPDMPIVEMSVGMTSNVFDYLTLAENAAEVHIIESSFEFLFDSFDHWKSPMVIHRYARFQTNFSTPVLSYPWRIL